MQMSRGDTRGQPGRGNKDRGPTTVLILPATISQFTTAGAGAGAGAGLGAAPTKAVRYIESRDITAGAEWYGGLLDLQTKVHTKVRNHGERRTLVESD